ncbi:MAG: DnaJ domain-containing protein [Sedimenticola sp.]
MGKKKNSGKPLKDYYSILGVLKNASPKEIRRRFRKAAQEWHPDRNSSPEAKKKFQELGEAYKNLKSEENRNEYDARVISEYCDTLLGGSFGRKRK